MANDRGYSIPTIDLAYESHRQFIVDREFGQYLGHPTTVLLDDGKTIIVVYPKGHGRGPIVMKKSFDGGKTWSNRFPVPETWKTSQEVPTLFRTQDPKGIKRIIMFSGLFPIRMATSNDEGETWSELEAIGDFGGIVAMGDVIRLKDGRYMAFFHDDGRFIQNSGNKTDVFIVYKTVSTDGGVCWSEPEEVVKHPHAHLCEPGSIRSPDGKKILLLLRENSRTMNGMYTLSMDEGRSWSEPVELPGALTGDRHQAQYAPDGRLVVSFRDTAHKTPTDGDWVAWVGTFDDIISGREGQYRVRLMKNHKGRDCAYPGILVKPDGTIVTTTYGHWMLSEEPFIISVHFTLKELDKKANSGLVLSQ